MTPFITGTFIYKKGVCMQIKYIIKKYHFENNCFALFTTNIRYETEVIINTSAIHVYRLNGCISKHGRIV